LGIAQTGAHQCGNTICKSECGALYWLWRRLRLWFWRWRWLAYAQWWRNVLPLIAMLAWVIVGNLSTAAICCNPIMRAERLKGFCIFRHGE